MTTPVAYRFTRDPEDRDSPTTKNDFRVVHCNASSLQALRTSLQAFHNHYQDAAMEIRVWRKAAKPRPGWHLLDTDETLQRCLDEDSDGLVLLVTTGEL